MQDKILKEGLAQMLKRCVIMDVTNKEEAKLAEKAGAVAVMALENVPSDIRKLGQVARMVDPQKVCEIKAATKIPFVCGAKKLGEALRRINEGAAMIRTKVEPGTGNIFEAVTHLTIIKKEISELEKLNDDELNTKAVEYRVPIDLVKQVKDLKRLPVVNFAAGGVVTPSDAALMMELGADGVFVGSGIFKSDNPQAYAKAIVQAVNKYNNPEVIAEVSKGLSCAMTGMEMKHIDSKDLMANRGAK